MSLWCGFSFLYRLDRSHCQHSAQSDLFIFFVVWCSKAPSTTEYPESFERKTLTCWGNVPFFCQRWWKITSTFTQVQVTFWGTLHFTNSFTNCNNKVIYTLMNMEYSNIIISYIVFSNGPFCVVSTVSFGSLKRLYVTICINSSAIDTFKQNT